MRHYLDATLAGDLSHATTPSARVEVLCRYMEIHGQGFYDESVTQLQHALQCAHLARSAGSAGELVAAALLHDLGHFLVDEQSDFRNEDLEHEAAGAEYLEPWMVGAVTEPVRLHVMAKRYLCTIRDHYYQGLSPASQRSFQLQGGPISNEQKEQFEQSPFFEEAILLRQWDDGAKVIGLKVPGLDSYHDCLQQSCRAVSEGESAN